ncbi:efflux RND transporter periplasmic adaptor subunit [Nitrogeniibacter mangrovi]|uniref:Efflux RND transporter periplasmic adaptor subunit n=1 Tax=Nitrogeniibacter mangrovi TaxID=2016596 RepID=A0A6C1B3Q5_9RHOO|nr:efflux RND transporter periplasmic adaptor subunit [Nitrogeniibacter mangrovi]QID16960.1 efflux RND transporter periplasmic adaptor subunit [Nitrogeniibacter mangrovi]
MRAGMMVAGLAALLVAGCAQEAPPTSTVATVLVQTVGDAAGEQVKAFTGEVVPRHASELGFRVGGKMIAREVDVGDTVRRGQVLARLDGSDLQLSVSAARAQVAAAQSDLALARSELARVEALRQQNFVSDSAVDARRTQAEAATARLREARAQLALAQNQTAYTTLNADADGVVTAVHADAGQVLSAGMPVVTVARDGEREVRINVPEGLQKRVAAGRAAKVTLWADRDAWLSGRVREVAPAADATTRTYAVKVTVDATAEALPLGATATVLFDGGAQPGVRVPLRAVGERDGVPVAWVLDSDRKTVNPVQVTVARFDEAGAVVSEGLAPGTQVVVAGIHLLNPGQVVEPVRASAPVALDAAR